MLCVVACSDATLLSEPILINWPFDPEVDPAFEYVAFKMATVYLLRLTENLSVKMFVLLVLKNKFYIWKIVFYLFIYLFIYLFVCLFIIYTYYLFIYYIYLFIYSFIHLFLFLFIYLFIYLF